MNEIIPSPGTENSNWLQIDKKLTAVRPIAKTIHIDIVDGKFAQNSTFFDQSAFETYTSNTFFELHMMVDNPVQYIDTWGKAGFKRFIGHVEMMPDQMEFIKKAREYGEVGLAIDAKTPLTAVRVPFDLLDCLLIMTINAGFSGQPFLPDILQKIQEAKNQTRIPIEVDGGITVDTIADVEKAGASRFVVTSALFSGGDPRENYQALLKALTG